MYLVDLSENLNDYSNKLNKARNIYIYAHAYYSAWKHEHAEYKIYTCIRMLRVMELVLNDPVHIPQTRRLGRENQRTLKGHDSLVVSILTRLDSGRKSQDFRVHFKFSSCFYEFPTIIVCICISAYYHELDC